MNKIVVIGGVAAGLKSAAKARRADPAAEITVVERGRLISYGACGMPYYVGGEISDIDNLMKTSSGSLRGPEFFQSVKNIRVLTETIAAEINRTEKVVTVIQLATGKKEKLPYDKLVIATGASAVKPPLPGAELGNIFTLWHPDDAKAIRQGIEAGNYKKAVIIGAGLVGMEMAEALNKQQLQVTVVEMKDQIFPAFLDSEIAEVAAKHLAEKGITLFREEKVLEFVGNKTVQAVRTDKHTLEAELVIVAVGARPNVELAKKAGLILGTTGAIAVDADLRTSDPDIYAGGDCVENTHIVSGKKVFSPMGSTANKHGRVIGENVCGAHVAFRGVLGTVVAKVHDMTVGKTGLSEREAKELGYEYITATVSGLDKAHYMPAAKPITVKLIVDAVNRKLLGMQAVGLGEVAKRVDVAAAALTFGGTIDDLFDIDLSYAPPYNSPIDLVAVAANSVMNKLAGKTTFTVLSK